ncbi:hypothetical protein X975_24294, partial [Stegodyphus mimosarum]
MLVMYKQEFKKRRHYYVLSSNITVSSCSLNRCIILT